MKTSVSHYEILGVTRDCCFQELKKAYFRKAKECHPDLFGGDRSKEAEFKILVNSFDILSDPVKRSEYDCSLGLENAETYRFSDTGYSIMDTKADDILEEIIVGNSPPETATMSTLFLDLEKTEVFMIFREGKNFYFNRKMGAAMTFFRKAVKHTPHNILYRFYLARTCIAAGRYGEAVKHYKHAIAVGRTRVPPQSLRRLHSELNAVRKKKSPWWYGITSLLAADQPENLFVETEAEMIAEANRAIANIIKDRKRKSRNLIKD